jgi:gamma-glutamyltranspeptidase
MDGVVHAVEQNTFSGNVDLYHSLIEVSKFAYAARSFLGDMDFVKNSSEVARNITSQWWADHIKYMQY